MAVVIEGVVVSGRRLGHTLGFPTANVEMSEGSETVESGVYLSRVEIEGEFYWGVTNIGTNPTVGGVKRRSESYILDFGGDLYGCHIRVELRAFLRGEVRFESVEALCRQIEQDVEQAREILSESGHLNKL